MLKCQLHNSQSIWTCFFSRADRLIIRSGSFFSRHRRHVHSCVSDLSCLLADTSSDMPHSNRWSDCSEEESVISLHSIWSSHLWQWNWLITLNSASIFRRKMHSAWLTFMTTVSSAIMLSTVFTFTLHCVSIEVLTWCSLFLMKSLRICESYLSCSLTLCNHLSNGLFLTAITGYIQPCSWVKERWTWCHIDVISLSQWCLLR
jgi:hypothetical protein